MATPKAVTVMEQTTAMAAGAELSSATYVGTNTAADIQLRVGRNAPFVSIVGTQTASRVYIGLDTDNAYAGAQVVVKRNSGTVGTSLISLYSGAAGTGFIPGNEIAVTTGAGIAIAAFDGVAKVWR